MPIITSKRICYRMSRYSKVRMDIMSGRSDANISEEDMKFFLSKIGASYKNTQGSHMKYWIDGIPELINIQPIDGKIKPYQVKEVRNIVTKYKLGKSEE